MQKIIRTLLKNSIKIRNVSICNTLQNHVNFSQDTLTRKALENHEANTNILNVLNLDNDPNSIIKNIHQTYKNMDVNTAIEVMNNLKDVVIKDEALSKEKIKDSEEFIHMCQLIQKNIGSLSINNVIRTLQVLFIFNVPVNSVLIQMLLQLIRTTLNDLSVGQIIHIYNMLKTQEKVPLIKSLYIALPRVFKQQAQFELNAESNNLLKALKFSCTVKDYKTTFYIINILLTNQQNIKPENIKDIFYALYILPKLNSISLKLLFKIKNKIKTNCQSLTFNEIETLLSYISAKVVTGKIEFYCDEMVDALCNAVLNHSATFRQNMLILKYLNKMRHGNTILLYHWSSKLLEDRYALKQCSVSDVDHFIKSFVIADYKPPNWESIQTLLLDFIKNNDYMLNNAAAVTFRLLSLGCYCPELVEKIFIMYEANNLKVTNEYTVVNISKLYWCIKVFYPEYTGIMLNKTTLNRMCINHTRDIDISLLESLKKILGGIKYIKSGLRTKYGEFIEHVIVIQANGLPMDLSNYSADIRYVEELDVPSECSKILFFAFPTMAYSINKQIMLNTVLLPLKTIETMKGYYVIDINPYLWGNLSGDEKVSWLQKTIKSKCNNADIPQCY